LKSFCLSPLLFWGFFFFLIIYFPILTVELYNYYFIFLVWTLGHNNSEIYIIIIFFVLFCLWAREQQ
jgi:hypothetical protein